MIGNGIKNAFLNLSLKQKMLLMMLPSVLIFVLSGVFIYTRFKEALTEKTKISELKTVDMVGSDVLTLLEKVESRVTNLSANKDLQEYLNFDHDFNEEVVLKSRVSQSFSDDLVMNKLVDSFYIIKDPHDYIRFDPYFTNVSKDEVNDFVNYMFNEYKEKEFYGFLKSGYNAKFGKLHYIRQVYGLKEYKVKGILVLNVNYVLLKDVFEKRDEQDRSYYAFDSFYNTVYTDSEYPENDIMKNISYTGNTGYYIRSTGAGSSMVFYRPLPQFKWTVCTEIPLKVVYSEIKSLTGFFIVMSVASILLTLLIYYKISSNFSKRIRELVEIMERIKAGDLESRFKMRYTDEISRIGSNLNEMTDRIKQLIFNISEKQLQKREAELSALQSQINPHFLYNTLETVRMVAIVNKDREAAGIIKTLSDLFRYSINRKKDVVYIEQEVEHMKKYLEIQSVRYEDKFDVDINIDSDILAFKTIKLILQPIVENAIYHGIETKPGKGYIGISGTKCDNEIRFVIEDNGIGIDEEELRSIKDDLEVVGSKEKKRSIGLKNVSDRIKLYFGPQYGIDIQSSKEKGTKIVIRIPALNEISGEAV